MANEGPWPNAAVQTSADMAGAAAGAALFAVNDDRPKDMAFSGLWSALFKLTLKNACLILITLGVYRFWAKTRVRQYFWHNIRIRGEALEYTGTPTELFIGFLIVLTVLIPIFAVYEGAAFLLSAAPAWTGYTLEAAYFIALMTFFQVAIFRLWRFRLSRTLWRGIRFGLSGSTWHYLGLAMGWTFLTALTLGLTYPWLRVATWGYRIRNTRYGQTAFDFDGRGLDLMKAWSLIYVVPLTALVGILAWQFPDIVAIVDSLQDGPKLAGMIRGRGPAAAAIILIPLLFPMLFLWFRVYEIRYVVRHTTWAGARLESHMHAGAVFFFSAVAMALWIILALGVFGVMVGYVVVAKTSGAPQFMTENADYLGLAMLALFLVFTPVITHTAFRYFVTGHFCRTFTIRGTGQWDAALQATEQGPDFGEGLADALDVGAV